MTASSLATSESGCIGVLDGREEAVITIEAFRKRLGVDGWIRLTSGDFDALPAGATGWVHFNLGTTSNVPGLRYALVPIVRPGSILPDGQEQVAYVDVARWRAGVCTGVRQSVPLRQVTAADFACSLPGIRDEAALRDALIARYARMYPFLSSSALVEKGCAITALRLEP